MDILIIILIIAPLIVAATLCVEKGLQILGDVGDDLKKTQDQTDE